MLPTAVIRRSRSSRAPAALLALCGLSALHPALALDPQRPFGQYAHDSWSMNDGLPFPGGYHLALDADGYLWLGSISGLARFDGQRFTVHERANTPAMPGNLIRGIALDGQGRLWIGSDRGVMYHHAGRFTALPALAGRNVHVLGAAPDGAMLLSNEDVVLRVGPGLSLQPVAGLHNVHLYIDHGGSWFATGNGLYHARADGSLQARQLPGLGQGHVTTMVSRDGQLLVGSTNGLYLRQDGRWQRHPHPALHKRILAMTADGDGNVWASTEYMLLRLRGSQVVEVVDVSSVSPAARAMLVDPTGSLWLASHADGLHRFWNGVGDYLPLPFDPSLAHFMWAVGLWQGQRLELLVAARTHDLAQANAQLDSLSRTDPLTGLHNRRHAAHEIPRRMDQARDEVPTASDGRPVLHLFVLMDIDNFKTINDQHGHEAGDAVLVEVARRLRQHLRLGDCLARWGGEEFLMVCFDLPAGEHVALAQRLLEAVRQAPVPIGQAAPLAVTVSLGLAVCPLLPAGCAGHWKQRVRQADEALYASKAGGRDRWTLYRPG